MTAPIRSVEDLVAAIRTAQIGRELSDERFEDIAGLPKGSVAKYLGPARAKGLGSISLPLMLGGLGKALVLVDDPEQVERVKGRWKRRNIVGGSAIQLREMAKPSAAASITDLKAVLRDYMREIGAKGNKMGAASNGGKRRAKLMSKRARQRIAAHAARIRWAKKSGPTP